MKQLNQVREWHEKYNVPIYEIPTFVPINRIQLRISLIKEEANELRMAFLNEPKPNRAKELCDLAYVVLGTVWEFGLKEQFLAWFKTETDYYPGLNTNNCLDSIQLQVKQFEHYTDVESLYMIFCEVGQLFEYMGIDFQQCFDEVHRSNMSKGTNGKPVFRNDGKILKGEDYEPAYLSFVR